MKYVGDIIATDANNSFMDSADFKEAYGEVQKSDIMGYLGNYDIRWRVHVILWAAKYASVIDGDFVDCGAGFGFYASAIYSYLNFEGIDKKYYMLDAFGEAEIEIQTFKKFGSWYESIIARYGSKRNAVVIKGRIPETLCHIDSNRISFLSIDLNCAKPELDCLESLWSRVTKGGIIVLDDYGFPGYEAQKEVHDNFARSKNLMIMSCPTGQGILLKP